MTNPLNVAPAPFAAPAPFSMPARFATPTTSQRPEPTLLDLAGTLLATLIDLAALLFVASHFPLVAFALLCPALISAARSSSKGYDGYRIWVRAAVVCLITVAVLCAALVVLFFYALSQWQS